MTHSDSSKPSQARALPLFQGILPIDRTSVPRDVLAGLSLAALSIPQVLAYARIAGMPIVSGLYTLLLPLVAFAVFGSSRYLVVAADSATAAILYGSLTSMAAIGSTQYASLAAAVAFLAGGFLLVARLFRLGFLADFLSRTVLIGFLTGVGFQVGIAVLGEMLGVEVHSKRTAGQLAEVLSGLSHVQSLTVCVSIAVVACILLMRRFAPKIPGPLIAVGGAMAASAYLNLAGHGVGIIGPVARGLPHLGLPEVHFRDASLLLSVAGSCFVVIVAQSAATARAYASSHHQSFDENSDLVGLGAANIMASLSGTFVVNGSPTQTTMVESSGGKSQIAHLSAAAVVALVALFLAGPLRFLPRCVLGAVVFTIAIHLIDIKGLRAMRRESPGEFNLAVATAAVVVVIGVEEGIVLAMVLSLLRIVAHSYRPHTAVLTCDETGYWRMTPVTSGAVTEPGIVVYYFGAPLYYANAQRFAEEVQLLAGSTAAPIRWLIVDSGAITHIDYTAARVVRDAQRQLARAGVGLALAHVQADLKSDLDRHNLTQTIGESHIFDRMHNALSALGEKK